MEFITSAINMLKIITIGTGGVLAAWGLVNLLEGYGADNPGARSQGIKQLGGGAGIILIGNFLIPKLADLLVITGI